MLADFHGMGFVGPPASLQPQLVVVVVVVSPLPLCVESPTQNPLLHE